jgi:protein-tyrosine phosphatase
MSNWFRTYGFAEILDHLLVGAVPSDAKDVEMLKWMGVNRILNLVEDTEYRPGDREAVELALADSEIKERRLRLTDFGGIPATALDIAVQTVNGWLDEDLIVYVHCRAGWQRSATVASAVVAVRRQLDAEDALDFVKRAKPSADPLKHQRKDLIEWLDTRRGSSAPQPASDDT